MSVQRNEKKPPRGARQGQDTTTRTLRQDETVVRSWLDQLDTSTGSPDASNKRLSARYVYRVRALKVEFQQQGGASWQSYQLPTRNISQRGISFLVGHFVYPGINCRVLLVSIHDHVQMLTGRVARCRYIEGSGTLHEVGVHFDRPIDISMFHRGAAKVRLLVADPDPTVQTLIERLLRNQHIEITAVNDGQQALDTALKERFDIVLMDLDVPLLDGLSAAKELRARGYSRPMVALSSREEHESRRECLSAGFTACLPKPLSRDALETTVASLREEPLVSSLMQDQSLAELIDRFVADLPERARNAEIMLVEKKFEELKLEARNLKGTAATYGFDPITQAAAELEEVLLGQQSPEVSEVRPKLSQLVRLCLAARPVNCVVDEE